MKNNLIKVGNDANKLLVKNGPLLLTVVGIVGMWTGAVMVAKAAPKAKEAVEKSRDERPEDLTKTQEVVEDVKAAAPLYLPAGIVLVGSTVCLVGSYKISADRIAKYAGAWALSEAKATEYQKKVIEKIGEKKEQEIRDEIVKDHMDAHADEQEVFKVDDALMDGKQLFFDDWSQRYFRCSYQDLFDAKETINKMLDVENRKGCRDANINLWYDMVELDPLPNGEDYGWAAGSEMRYHTVPHMCKDGLTSCTAIIFDCVDFRNMY